MPPLKASAVDGATTIAAPTTHAVTAAIPRAAVSLLNLAGISLESGDAAGAREWLRECLPLALELGYREVMVYGLVTLVRIAMFEGDAQRGAYLSGAADALIGETGVGLLPAAQVEFDQAKESGRRSLGEQAYQRAYAEGGATPVEDLLAERDLAPSPGHRPLTFRA